MLVSLSMLYKYACVRCWHNQFKISDPASCGSPDKQLNTTLEGKNHSVGAQISYACPLGHMLLGDKVRTCDTDAFWSGKAPSCKCEYTFYFTLHKSLKGAQSQQIYGVIYFGNVVKESG